jgi:DNA-binding response OmpR family regulator
MHGVRPLLLLVDDDPDLTVVVERLGRRLGHEVVSRVDVASARDYLGTKRPDLIILDLNLPGEPGTELCRWLRATPALADLSVALFSHVDKPNDLVAGLKAGADAVLSKDLVSRFQDWQDRLQELLTPAESRPYQRLLRGTKLYPLRPSEEGWLEPIHHTLRHRVLGRLDPEIAEILVDRALQQVGPEFPAAWLLPDGFGFALDRMARAQQTEVIVLFLAAVAEQLGYVLGSTTGAPLLAALAEAFPTLAEFLAPG